MTRRKLTEAEKRERYEQKKKSSREREADIARHGKDIGEVPDCADPDLKERMKTDLLLFLKTCFPEVFCLPWSRNHRKMAKYLEQTVFTHGKCAIVAPRSEGKTCFSEGTSLWMMLYGYAHFLLYVGATKEAATDSFDSIKLELETSETLLAFFPEVVYPIQSLEGQANRSSGQLCCGARTHIVWGKDKLVFPTIPGSVASGTVFSACGYDGRLRGRKHKTADGASLRPDAVIFDDVQKDKTGKNPANADYLERVLKRTVKFLGTRGAQPTIIVPGTRLTETCLMSRLMDHKKNPEWRGILMKAIDHFPENLDLWQEYRNVWVEEYERILTTTPLGADTSDAWDVARQKVATPFYRAHRDAMDAGASVSWSENVRPGDLSALQTLMDLYLDDPAAFMTEYQNEPQTSDTAARSLTRELLETKVIHTLPRGVVPHSAKRITFGIDVHQTVLFWAAVAWSDGFSGHIIDYGTFPQQSHWGFTVESAPRTFSTELPGAGFEGQLTHFLTTGVAQLIKGWTREDGTVMVPNLGLIDSNWERSRDTVETFVHRSRPLPLFPARGSRQVLFRYPARGKMESSTRFSYLTKKDRQYICQTVWTDTHKAKSFLLDRLSSLTGERGSMTICDARDRTVTDLLFNHLTSQYVSRGSLEGTAIEKWQLFPGRKEDHLWDCLVHCVVAEAMLGGSLDEVATPQACPPRRVFHSSRMR